MSMRFRFASPTVAVEVAHGSRNYEDAQRAAQQRAASTRLVPGAAIYEFEDGSSLAFTPEYYYIRT